MLKAVRNLFRKFGFVSTLVLALAFALPAAASEACAPEGEVPSRLSILSPVDDCGSAACEDCALICSGGCCHAPHPGVSDSATPTLSAFLVALPLTRATSGGLPARLPDGPERPPRV